jgi:hypothetical protein
MKKVIVSLIIGMFLLVQQVEAQSNVPPPVTIDVTSLGLGFGLDFGGFGGNIIYYPHKSFGLFAGAGYNFAGIGFNAGGKLRLISKNSASLFAPHALAMYGYNAAIAVTNASDLNKVFYGFSLGIGFDFRFNPAKKNYWTTSLLIPIRKAEVDDYMEMLKSDYGVEFENELMPVAFSFGYRIVLN